MRSTHATQRVLRCSAHHRPRRASGDADFGFLSRDLKPEEKTRLTTVPYAGTGTGLAANMLNVIGALNTDRVRRIYAGEITDWSQMGGPAR